MEKAPIIFSGIQPSGNLHLGNYLGAIKNWVKLQENHESFFCVVDLHAITVPQDPKELRKRIIEIAKIYLAAGIDPAKSTIFVQSDVSEHSELMWLLNTLLEVFELQRMTQFKEKAGIQNPHLLTYKKNMQEIETQIVSLHFNEVLTKLDYEKLLKDFRVGVEKELLNAVEYEKRERKTPLGILNYPVLMAADILLYNTDVVPVGEDQTQHIELTRDLAKRFNHRFGETFKLPKAHIQKEGMRIMGLDDPLKKMSKSAPSEYNRINLLDSADEIRNKIKKATTDSERGITYTDKRPAVKNLLNILSLTSDKSPEELVAHFEGKGFKELKEELAESIVNFLSPFQEKYNSISDEEVRKILDEGKVRAQKVAQKKIADIKQKMGL